MTLSLVAAIAKDGTIGDEGKSAWNLPADMRRFREITWGHTIVMGRKTYEKIGQPLTGRTNIVVTRNPGYQAPGCTVVTSIEEAMSASSDQEEIFVIGGAEIYKLAEPLASRFYLTEVHHSFNGSTKYIYNTEKWQIVSSEPHEADEENKYAFSFKVLKKNDEA